MNNKEKYNIGEVWWTRLSFEDSDEDKNVKGVRLAQGDGGIDVFVGNIGQEKIDVYQSKYFDAGLRSSQWKQITDSYNRAKKTRINTRWQDRSIYPERRLSGQIFINITGIKWKCKYLICIAEDDRIYCNTKRIQ